LLSQALLLQFGHSRQLCIVVILVFPHGDLAFNALPGPPLKDRLDLK